VCEWGIGTQDEVQWYKQLKTHLFNPAYPLLRPAVVNRVRLLVLTCKSVTRAKRTGRGIRRWEHGVHKSMRVLSVCVFCEF
jgi:hypothetical protein